MLSTEIPRPQSKTSKSLNCSAVQPPSEFIPGHDAEILRDVDAAGFDGVEPLTATFLNDEAMAEIEQLLHNYKNLRMSTIYWCGPFNVRSEHDRSIKEVHGILGY